LLPVAALVACALAGCATSETDARDAPAGGPAVGKSPSAAGSATGGATDGPLPADPRGSASGSTATKPASGSTRATTTTGGSADASAPVAPTPRSPLRGTVSIGIYVYDAASARAAGAAFGANGADQVPDTEGIARAIVDVINADGGVAGRRIVPVFQHQDVTRNIANNAAEAEAACTAFTEDNHVFAVVQPISGGGENFIACLAGNGTPLIVDNLAHFDDALLAQYADHLFLPGLPNSTRFSRFTVDGLAQQGFYPKGVRLGIVRPDNPIYDRTVERGLAPALAAHGVPIVDDVRISYTNAAQYENAVLKFKTARVTHVQFLDVTGLVAFQFMNAAEPQGFRPRYGLNSTSGLSAALAGGNVPTAQLHNAIGVGWLPTFDVAAAELPSRSASATRCLALLKSKGLQPRGTVEETFYRWSCTTLFFLKAALDRSGELSIAGLRRGAESLGTDFEPASTFAARFGPGRHDGASAARHLAFDDRCTCWRYAGPLYGVG
jgi:ABC-type branched-subunit amino acid transport system substrate-binding protein